MTAPKSKVEVGQTLYRAADSRVRYFGTDGITLEMYVVTKVTPCGCWIVDKDIPAWVLGPRFMRTDAFRRFAWPTESEALESYLARKTRQVQILKRQLWRAFEHLNAARKRLGLPAKPWDSNPTISNVLRYALPVADDR